MTNAENLTRTLFIADNLPVLRGLDSESIDLNSYRRAVQQGREGISGHHGGGRER